MNLANEVSALESAHESLKAEVEALRKLNSLLNFENEQNKRAFERIQSERDSAMRQSSALKVLLDQAGASLVAGIQKLHSECAREQGEATIAEEMTKQITDTSATL